MESGNVTLTCAYCNQDFCCTHWERESEFCSDECERLGQRRNVLGYTAKCITCKEEFWHFGDTNACSVACSYKYVASQKLYPQQPLIGDSGLSPLCILCGVNESTRKHYIDLNPQNTRPSNTAPVCNDCHRIIEQRPIFWQIALAALFSGSKIVRKGWGFEVHLTNTPKYCLKYLVFYPHKKFSLHYHVFKTETWYCLLGKLEGYLGQERPSQHTRFTLCPGQKMLIVPSLIHQLHAMDYSIITEVSTRDYPEDSFRLQKGD